MTDLETLKDWAAKWRIDMDTDPCVPDIRQEAIKWVKYFRANSEMACKGNICDEYSAEKKFMLFFNLTEEDLYGM